MKVAVIITCVLLLRTAGADPNAAKNQQYHDQKSDEKSTQTQESKSVHVQQERNKQTGSKTVTDVPDITESPSASSDKQDPPAPKTHSQSSDKVDAGYAVPFFYYDNVGNAIDRDVIVNMNFPDPINYHTIDKTVVEKVIIRRLDDRTLVTSVILWPDVQGMTKTHIYRQTRLDTGKFTLKYEDHVQVGKAQKFTIQSQKSQFEEASVPSHDDNNVDQSEEQIDALVTDFEDDSSDDGIADVAGAEELHDEPELEVELTEEQKLAQQLYNHALPFLNSTIPNIVARAYDNLRRAASYNHTAAMELVAVAYLFGDHLPQNITRARELFSQLSTVGSPRGQLGLGLLYTMGMSVNSSQARALVFFTFAALGGDPFAQMALGYRYWAGVGVEANCETALVYYQKVAARVAAEVTASGGTAVHRIRLYDEAESPGASGTILDDDLVQYYQYLADKGDIQAQVGLGQLYFQGGRGLDVDHGRALNYFLHAAEAGNTNAMAYLGKMYMEGGSVVKADNKTAFDYFKKSADKGNPIGQSGLGMMYLQGRGVEQDFGKAFKYFTLAADQGWVDGQLQLAIMYYSGQGVRQDYKQALKYFHLASQSGHVLAFYYLAQMHATGTGVLRACHTATELFKNVAERGHWSDMLMEAHDMYSEGRAEGALLKYMFLGELGYEVAQSNVAYILDNGDSRMFEREEIYQRALLQWNRAAYQGYAIARLKLGDYHYYGYGTAVDYEVAASHYQVASDTLHNAQATFNLGYMHEHGLGLKKDMFLAKRFYDLANEMSADAQVPVALAMCKLFFMMTIDYITTSKDLWELIGRLDPRPFMGAGWDIYLITLLAVLLGFMALWRRTL